MRYHITAKGEPGPCTAQVGNCPLGNEGDHYSTQDEARHAYEASMEENTFVRTRVQHNERYTVKFTTPGGTSGSYGDYDTPEEAYAALDEEVDPGDFKVVKVRYTSKTVNITAEDDVPRPGSFDAKYPGLKLEDNAYDNALKESIVKIQARYDALEEKRGWLENVLSEAGKKQAALKAIPATDLEARKAAREELNQARIDLLAADMVQVYKSGSSDTAEIANSIVKSEKERKHAEEVLREAYNGSHYSIASNLRIQPEDVAYVYGKALNRFTPLRNFHQGGLSNLDSLSGELSRGLRIQPEDVDYILRRAR